MNSVTEKKGTFPQNGFLPVTPDGLSDVDREEKQRLIKQVLELQHTLVDLSKRVDAVKEENVNLRSENQILGQYIEKLMATSSIFQSSSPPPPTSGSHMGHSVSSSTGAADGSTDSFHYEECSELASEDDIA